MPGGGGILAVWILFEMKGQFLFKWKVKRHHKFWQKRIDPVDASDFWSDLPPGFLPFYQQRATMIKRVDLFLSICFF